MSVAIFLLALTGLAVWLIWVAKNRYLWGVSIAPLLWLVTITAFYGYLLFWEPTLDENLAIVSAAIRLYDVLIVLGAGAILLGSRGRKNVK